MPEVSVSPNALYKRQVRAQKLEEWKLYGTCVRCYNMAVAGRKHCAYHLDMLDEHDARKRAKRIAEDKCPKCATPNSMRPKDDPRCPTCLEHQRRWEATRRKTPRNRNRSTRNPGNARTEEPS